MNNYANIQCQATYENEVMLRCMVSVFISKLNPTLDEMTEVKTLMSEAVTNVILHGYQGKHEGEIQVEMKLNEQQLELVVIDFGCGIENLEQAKEPLYTTKPELERSGMGLTIMESLSDTFEITSKVNQGTRIQMTKVISKTHEFDN